MTLMNDDGTPYVPKDDDEFRACEMTFELVPIPGTPFSTLKPVKGSFRFLGEE